MPKTLILLVIVYLASVHSSPVRVRAISSHKAVELVLLFFLTDLPQLAIYSTAARASLRSLIRQALSLKLNARRPINRNYSRR